MRRKRLARLTCASPDKALEHNLKPSNGLVQRLTSIRQAVRLDPSLTIGASPILADLRLKLSSKHSEAELHVAAEISPEPLLVPKTTARRRSAERLWAEEIRRPDPNPTFIQNQLTATSGAWSAQ